MKRIELTQGKYALVDDSDFEYLNQWKWCVGARGYAMRGQWVGEKTKMIYMHQLILKSPRGFDTDHVNRNKLDNRRDNLRTLTHQQNGFNSKLSKNNKSGVSGVSWYKNRWVSRIKLNYKNIYLGRFEELKDAILARKNAERIYWA